MGDKFFDQCWIYYCFCMGDSFHAPNATGQFIAASYKEFCCGGAQVLESPITKGVCCSTVGTFLCCWNESRCLRLLAIQNVPSVAGSSTRIILRQMIKLPGPQNSW